jgi:hypothetical protein
MNELTPREVISVKDQRSESLASNCPFQSEQEANSWSHAVKVDREQKSGSARLVQRSDREKAISRALQPSPSDWRTG